MIYTHDPNSEAACLLMFFLDKIDRGVGWVDIRPWGIGFSLARFEPPRHKSIVSVSSSIAVCHIDLIRPLIMSYITPSIIWKSGAVFSESKHRDGLSADVTHDGGVA